MLKLFKKTIKKGAGLFGYQLVKSKAQNKIPPDIAMDRKFLEIYKICQNYTMTSVERMYALHKAVEYVIRNNLKGDFVECGVWRGGSAMLMALSLQELGDLNRQLYLYDTYEGMVEPTQKDINYKGGSAQELLKKQDKASSRSVWCYASLSEVKMNLKSTGYPIAKIKFIKGRVEETIPQMIPSQIAILRLDTDWYESTRHELKHLYPLLVKGGILIIDDYGHWQGARQAVDEYLNENKINNLLNRIDYTGRLLIK